MDALNYHRIFHEIKNTITLINSSVQLLNRKRPDLSSEPNWETICQQTSYLKNMILEISLNGNMEHLQLESLDINHVIQSSQRYMNDCFPNLKWELELSDLLPEINGDNVKLIQAFVNILKNSAEAMDGAGAIHIQSSESNSMIQVNISDMGGGIPPEFESKIFDMFTTSKHNGTGLGLPITKQIIEDHHGTLSVTNRPGNGCTFSILLPPI